MSTSIPATVGDLLASDLRAYYLSAVPSGSLTDPDRIRLRDTPGEPPCPRIEISPGEIRRVPQMDGTSRIMLNLALVHSKDDPELEAQHLAMAARLDDWWRALCTDLRPGPFQNLYLHGWLTQQPTSGFREDERERITTLRTEAIVTLCVPEE